MSDEEDSNNTLEEKCKCKCTKCSHNCPFEVEVSHEKSFAFAQRLSKKKKQKTNHCTAEIVGEAVDKNGNTVPMRVLIDTGATKTLGLAHMVSGLSLKACKSSECTTWEIMDL